MVFHRVRDNISDEETSENVSLRNKLFIFHFVSLLLCNTMYSLTYNPIIIETGLAEIEKNQHNN